MMLNRCRKKGERGNAIVEFAIAVGLIFPVFYGTFQFGYSFFLYNKLVNATRTGARYASLLKYNSDTPTPPANYSSAVRNVTVYGDPAGGTTPVVPGLTTAMVAVEPVFARETLVSVGVRINGYPLNSLFRVYTMNKPLVTFPYSGVYAPP